MDITVYTDGGCLGNPGPGGWAYVLTVGDETAQASGGEPDTTNNRMELTAVIQALRSVKNDPRFADGRVSVFTDSAGTLPGSAPVEIQFNKRNGLLSQAIWANKGSEGPS